MNPIPKNKRVIDKKYLKAINDNYGCIVLGCFGASCAHHITGYGFGGMGTKPDDYLTMPLCQKHHAEVHADFKKFERTHKSQKFYILRTLSIARERGYITKDNFRKYEKTVNEIEVKK